MNLSEVITAIQMKIGIYKIALPFDEPTESVLTDVIQNITLPTFSMFHPYYETIDFNLGNDLTKLSQTSNSAVYQFPDVFYNRKILFVKRIEYKDDTCLGLSYYGGIPMNSSMIQQSMIANASSHIAAKMIPRITFKWIAPNKIEIFNAINAASVRITFAFSQDKSLGTIEDTCWDSFLELAILDCKSFLYNTFKHYNEIPSAYGSISLRMDDWQSAESDRKSLIDEWEASYHVDMALYEFS